jgi:ribonuclease HI
MDDEEDEPEPPEPFEYIEDWTNTSIKTLLYTVICIIDSFVKVHACLAMNCSVAWFHIMEHSGLIKNQLSELNVFTHVHVPNLAT